MKKVLVTGSSGFMGSHIAKYLKKQSYEVVGFDLDDGLDIRDPLAVEMAVSNFKPDWIIHLAAQPYLKPSMQNPQKDAESNIIGTINVLEAARKNNSGLLLASSGAVYGSNDRSHISELHDCEPISPYGLSKLTAEKYALLWHQLYGIPAVVFRFSSVYGAGRKASVNLIVQRALMQRSFHDKIPLEDKIIHVTGDGYQTRDYVHVDDVAEAVRMAVENQFPSGVYNIGTGVATSVNGLVRVLEELLGQRLVVEYVARVEGDPVRNDFDVSKASSCGWTAKIGLKEGLARLIEEMRKGSSAT